MPPAPNPPCNVQRLLAMGDYLSQRRPRRVYPGNDDKNLFDYQASKKGPIYAKGMPIGVVSNPFEYLEGVFAQLMGWKHATRYKFKYGF